MKHILILLFCCLGFYSFSQTGKNQSLAVIATCSADPGFIKFDWPADNFTGTYNIYKRLSRDDQWGNPIISLAGTDSSYTDSNIVVGEAYEYRFFKSQGSNLVSLGYLYAGVQKQAYESEGHIILLIDTSYAAALDMEIDRLESDLRAEAWSVSRKYVSRSESPEDIKDELFRSYIDRSEDIKSIFIIGHVPVPYCGDFSSFSGTPPPDGHVEGSGNHTGAWPSDSYYGDFFGNYTDNTVYRTTGNQSRHHNVPNDGKFDQTNIPGDVMVEIGRVDFFDMPAFAKSDTQLLKDYFDRNHAYRTGSVQSVDRAVIDDNFRGLNLSSTAWHNLSAFFPIDSIHHDQGADYFGLQKTQPYLWSYGCGAGSYTSCNGIGRTSDFVNDSLQNVFTMLAGSYFGDWDSRNNLMRAATANSALVCFWGGIPKWYIHHMALGKNIGYGAKISQNNVSEYFNGQFNLSHNKIHIALIGDPSLKLHYFEGLDVFSATSERNKVKLNWNRPVNKVEGYMLYRVSKDDNRPFKIHSGILDTNYFEDINNNESGPHEYMVRAVQFDTTASGSYENLSPGIFTLVNHNYIAVIEVYKESIFDLKVYPNPSKDFVNLQFTTFENQEVSFSLKDINGRNIGQENFKSQQGINQRRIDLSGLSKGIYLLELREGSGNMTYRKITLQ